MISSNKLAQLNWHKVQGLMPAVIQDAATLQVLMLGYMNEEALKITLETKKITFFSRTKNRLWTKGETSGNELNLVSMSADCDNDSLLILATPKGFTCHLNKISCFTDQDNNKYASDKNILTYLTDIIESRYEQRPKNSYVTQLFEQGIQRIAQKVGEEAVEFALAGLMGIKDDIINEAADLIFHLLVLLKACEINLTDVLLELNRRAS